MWIGEWSFKGAVRTAGKSDSQYRIIVSEYKENASWYEALFYNIFAITKGWWNRGCYPRDAEYFRDRTGSGKCLLYGK